MLEERPAGLHRLSTNPALAEALLRADMYQVTGMSHGSPLTSVYLPSTDGQSCDGRQAHLLYELAAGLLGTPWALTTPRPPLPPRATTSVCPAAGQLAQQGAPAPALHHRPQGQPRSSEAASWASLVFGPWTDRSPLARNIPVSAQHTAVFRVAICLQASHEVKIGTNGMVI